ncbi:MAG: urease accessory protein UreJ [Rickettsiaceae bacterium]|nr:urease accessory protein UreJ [Rickettsiaceae bacterium]
MKKHQLLSAFASIVLLPFTANAGNISEGFISGISNPILHLDYFLAILCTGIISTQIGGRPLWKIPAIFIAAMLIGSIISMIRIYLPFSGYILSLSVFCLGLTVTLSKHLPEVLIIAIIALFGLFHGYSHATETPLVVSRFPYIVGYVIGAIAVSILGIVVGKFAKTFKKGPLFLRYGGAVMAGMGLQLMVTMLDL